MTDIDTWADTAIRTLDADGWREVNVVGSLGRPDVIYGRKGSAVALLAARDRLIAGLSDEQCTGLLATLDDDENPPAWDALVALGLLGGDCDVQLPSIDVTPLGHECARVLEERGR